MGVIGLIFVMLVKCFNVGFDGGNNFLVLLLVCFVCDWFNFLEWLFDVDWVIILGRIGELGMMRVGGDCGLLKNGELGLVCGEEDVWG